MTADQTFPVFFRDDDFTASEWMPKYIKLDSPLLMIYASEQDSQIGEPQTILNIHSNLEILGKVRAFYTKLHTKCIMVLAKNTV